MQTLESPIDLVAQIVTNRISEMNLTEAAVTRLAGLPPQTIKQLRRGHKPKAETLVALAEVLDFDPTKLIYVASGRHPNDYTRRPPAYDPVVAAKVVTVCRSILEERSIAPDDFGLLCAEVLGSVLRVARGGGNPDIAALTAREVERRFPCGRAIA